MTNREKIEAVRGVQDFMSEISELLGEIIENTFDYYCRGVDKFTVGDSSIDVKYWWRCRGEDGYVDVSIPIEWLDEGFDYVGAYNKNLEAKRKEEMERAAAEEKKEKERKEREEYKLYLELMKKYEGDK